MNLNHRTLNILMSGILIGTSGLPVLSSPVLAEEDRTSQPAVLADSQTSAQTAADQAGTETPAAPETESTEVPVSETSGTSSDIENGTFAFDAGSFLPESAASEKGTAEQLDVSLRTAAPVKKQVKTTATKPAAKRTPVLYYRSHVQSIGWQAEMKNNAVSGTTGKKKRMEAIRIRLDSPDIKGNILYRAHVQNKGWMGWSRNNAVSGTTGKSLRMEAVEIKLDGEIAKQYDIYYRVHVQNKGWMGWTKNGGSAGTQGGGLRMEAIQIQLVKKGAKAPACSTAFQKIVKPKNTTYTPASGKTVRFKSTKQEYNFEGIGESGVMIWSIGGWAPGSNQAKTANKWRRQAASKKWKNGVASMDGMYMVACSTAIGHPGDVLEVTLKNGKKVKLVVLDIWEPSVTSGPYSIIQGPIYASDGIGYWINRGHGAYCVFSFWSQRGWSAGAPGTKKVAPEFQSNPVSVKKIGRLKY